MLTITKTVQDRVTSACNMALIIIIIIIITIMI